MREGNRKDVPSEMRNRFVRLFVSLFVSGVALRASTKLWRGVRGVVYIYVRGFIRLFIVFGQFFDLEGGGRHRISANFFPVSQKSWPKSVNFFFTASPKNRKYHLQKWCSFIRLSYLRLKFFVSKGVFIHKITSEGWQTIREGRARLWEP